MDRIADVTSVLHRMWCAAHANVDVASHAATNEKTGPNTSPPGVTRLQWAVCQPDSSGWHFLRKWFGHHNHLEATADGIGLSGHGSIAMPAACRRTESPPPVEYLTNRAVRTEWAGCLLRQDGSHSRVDRSTSTGALASFRRRHRVGRCSRRNRMIAPHPTDLFRSR